MTFLRSIRIPGPLCRPLAALLVLAHAAPGEGEPIQQLAAAVEQGDLATVRKLLAAGIDPNIRVPGRELGYTPLFLAVKANRPAITEALLQAGADPAIEDENGDPVMVHAADAEVIGQARLLIEHGVSIDSRNRGGVTALLRGAPYEKAADVQAKIDLGATVDLPDPAGNTALMIAAGSLNLDAVKVLLKAGANPNLRNRGQDTALLRLAGRDYFEDRHQQPGIEVAKELLQAGADPNLCDAEGRNALLLALDSWSAGLGLIGVLIDATPDLSARDKEGNDALLLAAGREKPGGLVQKLLDRGADPKTTNHQGTDLLMLAAVNLDPNQVRDLLARGLSPTRKDKAGATAVHCVFRRLNPGRAPFAKPPPKDAAVEVLKLLAGHGASLTEPDGDGDTPVHLAAAADSRGTLEFLLPHFADAEPRNAKGETPLHSAAGSWAEDAVKLLLAKGVEADPRDHGGCTPFMRAISGGLREAALRLLTAGANINTAAEDGTTALAAALDEDRFDDVRFLVEQGADTKSLRDPDGSLSRVARLYHERPMKAQDYAFMVGLFAGLATDVNRRDEEGRSVLMWVAASNNQAALKPLLERRPDLQARSPDGRTALMWAACARAVDSMQALRAAGADDSLRDAGGRSADDWLAWAKAPHEPAPVAVPTGQAPLGERILSIRRAALAEYLKRGIWDKDDVVAGSPPLHLAAALGETAALEALLECGAPVDQPGAGLSTPLMEAAANGRTEAATWLLEHGADPAGHDADGWRPIDHAVALGHADTARLLLRRKGVPARDESGLLTRLVHLGDEELLREFFAAGARVLSAAEEKKEFDPLSGRSSPRGDPLAAAAVRGDPRMLRVLVEFPAASGAGDPVLLAAALHQAASEGRLANVKYLVEEQKVDPNMLLEDSFGGVTTVAVGGLDDKPRTVQGYSALSRALEEGWHEVVDFLLERGAKPIGRTRGGQSPLSFTIEHRQPEMLRRFLEHGAPTELPDLAGETALHCAARRDDAGAVALLLQHGADPHAKTPEGQTALDLARKAKAHKAVNMLEKADRENPAARPVR